MSEGNTIHFTSLGCARNLVDSEVMLGILLKAGYEVGEAAEADFLVVNTCGFLESAREESCQTIEGLFIEKKAGAKIIVAGCMVQKHREELQKRFPDIHSYLTAGEVDKILEAIAGNRGDCSSKTAKSYLQSGEVPRQVSTPKHYAYLKIAEGCAKQCAFCIIPKIKGPLKSKPIDQVVKECHILLDQGVQEIILIAQDLGDFGKETRDKQDLLCLLKALCAIDRPFWIRLLYLYPDEITEELIELLAENPKILRYLDMPIQHINDDILQAMRRKTSKQQIIQTINMLRTRLPDIVIRTSLMVGFPGETEEQFQELVDFVREYALDNIGIFSYSYEEESPSAKYPGHISKETKEQRHQLLAKVQLDTLRKHAKKWVGKVVPVMIEGYHAESKFLMRGRHYGQCPEIDGQVILHDIGQVKSFGQRYEVQITGVADYDLLGKVLSPMEKKQNRGIARPLTLVGG